MTESAKNRDKEIYGIASVYIREYGDDAVIQAATRADALLDASDLEGQNVWLRVIEAIKVLSSPAPGSLVHEAWLLSLVAAEPDLTLQEIRKRLADERGAATCVNSLWRFYERHR
ncbi:MAG: hypothetical protein QF666_16050, partial [Alphaproteobacteria bacterium]|nr:hypothetical protein [Alphaproteobacteria bacterium]